METDSNSDTNYLPDLSNEKTGKQIVFKLNVKWLNESFIRRVDELIKWLTSPSDCHIYPKSANTNWHAYKKHAHQFIYDEKKGILYKKVKNTDGIGE